MDEATSARGIVVHPLPVRSVLNRSSGKRVQMDLTLNPYRGCEFGCRYCFARYTHQWLERPDPLAFERQLYAKVDAPEVLAGELARMSVGGRSIAIGTATDPYQPIERELGITRGVLEVLAQTRGARLSLLTKSDLVTRDIDVLAKLHERHELRVSFTMVTLDRRMQRKLEPRAPTPEKRLRAMAELAGAGLAVGVSYAPLLPGINDGEPDMNGLLAAAAEAGARHAFGQVLWVPDCAREVLLDWLREQFPAKVAWYRRLYRDGVDPPSVLKETIRARLAEAIARHGLTPGVRPGRGWDGQMRLFEGDEG